LIENDSVVAARSAGASAETAASEIGCNLVYRDPAVAVLVESLQGRCRAVDLVGRDLAIMIRIERVKREVELAGTASAESTAGTATPAAVATTTIATGAPAATRLLAIRLGEFGDLIARQNAIVVCVAAFE
jgi:hypothetical protein